MIDCSKVTQLTVVARERPLSWWQRLSLGIHRLICAPCRAYHRQLTAMRGAARKLAPTADDSAGAIEGNAMSGDARDRIRARLRQAQGD